MQENIMIESVNTYQKKILPMAIISAIIAVVALITVVSVQKPIDETSYLVYDVYDLLDEEGDDAREKLHTLYNVEEMAMFGLVIGTPIAILLFVFYWYVAKMQIVVTDKRVYGKSSFGKHVDLPLDSISAVGTSPLKGIAVGTSSGKISFMGIGNRDNVYEEIKKILVGRQEKERKATASVTNIVQELSSADELMKYKELLDSGIISQDEFDAKKKQLLEL